MNVAWDENRWPRSVTVTRCLGARPSMTIGTGSSVSRVLSGSTKCGAATVWPAIAPVAATSSVHVTKRADLIPKYAHPSPVVRIVRAYLHDGDRVRSVSDRGRSRLAQRPVLAVVRVGVVDVGVQAVAGQQLSRRIVFLELHVRQ